ncbi:hypothetical protein D5S17_15230 [Pseudonocardiaceae bacterium YIM PH 21723]|nr:hypothetical protein D5S17_15230 [Pseudonocardiaceae bacterium YIM PH 21723]
MSTKSKLRKQAKAQVDDLTGKVTDLAEQVQEKVTGKPSKRTRTKRTALSVVVLLAVLGALATVVARRQSS